MVALEHAYQVGWKSTLLYLIGYRPLLEKHNLLDGYAGENYPTCSTTCPQKCEGNSLKYRTLDGTCNDLKQPMVGAAGMRFGRNMNGTVFKSEAEYQQNLLDPNPRLISQGILKREKPIEIPGLNLLVTSWIQFQTHDWVFHDMTDYEKAHVVPLPENDHMRSSVGATQLKIPRTVPDVEHGPQKAAWYKNLNTAWWDLSQVYGSTVEANKNVRTGVDGKLKFEEKDDWIPIDPKTKREHAGFSDNWWTGIAMWHNIYTKEHNYVCGLLKKAYPDRFDPKKRDPAMIDQELHDLARLAVTCVNAKVHTIEWTEAVLNNKALRIGMHANWYGISGRKSVQDVLREIPGFRSSAVFTGLVRSKQKNDGVPFSLTEEFTSVYRMHSLLPDVLKLRRLTDPETVNETPIKESAFDNHATLRSQYKFADLLYSFGRQQPTALTVNNYPQFLMDLQKPGDSEHVIDLAVRDIVRERERGVPRYNAFRRAMNLTQVKDFDDLTTDKKVAATLKKLYDDKIEKVDLLVGCLAEQPRPKNFGFGETAFSIFIIMASRRLKTDRFLNGYFNKKVYTPVGYDYAMNTGMKEIFARQYPELKDKFMGEDKASRYVFQAWKP